MTTQKTLVSGTHILLDINHVSAEKLRDDKFVRDSMIQAAKDAGANILHDYFHHFGGQWGVTGIVAVSESHLSIHTWPEFNYASIDIYLCRGMDPRVAADSLIKSFDSHDYDLQVIERLARVVLENPDDAQEIKF